MLRRITFRASAELHAKLMRLRCILEEAGHAMSLSSLVRILVSHAVGRVEPGVPVARACKGKQRSISVSVCAEDSWVVERIHEDVRVHAAAGLPTSFSREFVAAAKRGLMRRKEEADVGIL